ncbi:MAG: hypothetical protein AAFN93_03885 [Bacteroidota bacterium]
MFSENEIATMIDIKSIQEATQQAKSKFVNKEVELLEISDHDFLSLVMMTPAIGVALANGSISLFEELALNKMARKMSKGGYFLKADPVAHAMKYLIGSFDEWESEFIEVIKICMKATFDLDKLNKLVSVHSEDPIKCFARDLMNVPYIFVRFLSTMILNDESDIVDSRNISQVEFAKIMDLGEKLGLADIPVFQSFGKTFQVK